MAKTPTHVAFARAKQCLEARRRSRAGASEGGVGIHAGHNPIDVRVGKQKAAASRRSYNLQLACGERQVF